ncbi:DUF6104 family protein [Kibdelosporangium lantanae]|uniref:DUF6104 family protein n=1 Tax=Kibdelosporangium lantanae TaxID=1497396 RepID=A0ABW3M8X8_9PSEU
MYFTDRGIEELEERRGDEQDQAAAFREMAVDKGRRARPGPGHAWFGSWSRHHRPQCELRGNRSLGARP